MQIVLDDGAHVQLIDQDNFKAFSVRVPDGWIAADLAAAVERSGLGQADDDGEHIQVSTAKVRNMVHIRDDDWHRGFDLMIKYAASQGWVSQDGALVRAHVERV